MARKKFEELVFDMYNARADYPFEEDFETGVFRHESDKWFALAMNIGERKIGHVGDEKIDVVNLKCAPEVIESLAGIEPGIYRAYHMNKTHWLTIAPAARLFFLTKTHRAVSVISATAILFRSLRMFGIFVSLNMRTSSSRVWKRLTIFPM